jgi:hypothetical protein
MELTRDEGTTTEALTPEVLELLARSTEIPRGLAFVRRAPLECVAISLRVHARTVDRARDHLDRAEKRELVIREYARLLEERRASGAPALEGPASHAVTSAVSAPPQGPLELIDAAAEHPLGVAMIACSPLETVAITFRVHPDVVADAREILAARGVVAEPHAEA